MYPLIYFKTKNCILKPNIKNNHDKKYGITNIYGDNISIIIRPRL